MREIKFRAWDKTNNKMYIDHTFHIVDTDSFDEVNFEVKYLILNESLFNITKADWGVDSSELVFISHDYVLMQYTGLKDKNGVEIYEGDIVEGGFEKHRGVVIFGLYANPFGSDEWTGYQGFYIKWSREHAEMTRGDMGYWINRGMETAVEVIGNKYEHPELLK